MKKETATQQRLNQIVTGTGHDNLIIAFDQKPDGKRYLPMLTIGRLNHDTKRVEPVANYTGDEAIELYHKLLGEGGEKR